MNKSLFVIALLFALCGCIKINKSYSDPSSNTDNSRPGWNLMGGTYQGSGLSLKGIVTTYSGNRYDASGTDGKLSEASFNQPDTITINKEYVFITEAGNPGIRKINLVTGEVTTILKYLSVAGQYFRMTSHGDFLYVFDSVHYAIMKVDIKTEAISLLAGKGISGNDDGYGPQASFNGPGNSMTTDGKYLYLLDASNLIRKINIITGYVSTVSLGLPDSLFALTTDGEYLYATSTLGILKISINDGSYSLIHQGIYGEVCVDGKYLYFTNNSKSIQKLSLKTNVVEDLAGHPNIYGFQDGVGINALFSRIGMMVSDGKKLYVLDADNHLIRVIE